jgi:hypothetical protein
MASEIGQYIEKCYDVEKA